MRKLTMLGLSLLLSVGASAQAPLQHAKAQKLGASRTARTEVTTSLQTKVRSLDMAPENSTVTGKFVEHKTATSRALLPSKAKIKANASVTSENIYAGVLVPATAVGGGKINPATGAYTAIYSSASSNHGIGKNPDTDVLYSIEYNQSSGGIGNIFYHSYNATTGAVLSEKSISGNELFSTLPQRSGYCPTDNSFYGYASGGWVKIDCNTWDGTVINGANEDFPLALAYNANSEKFFAIVFMNDDYDLGIAPVDKTTGNIGTGVALTGLNTTSYAGFAYDMQSDSYLLNLYNDGEATLYSIDAKTYAVSEVCTLNPSICTGGFYVDEMTPPDPLSPQAPEFLRATFPNGSLSGTITFTLPTKTIMEGNLTAGLTYTIKANGVAIASGVAAPGVEVSASYTATAEGNVEFSCVALSGTHESKAATETLFIGNDTPAVPKNVKLTPATVSWDAVTTGANGGYINASQVTYTVKINDEVVADGIKATSCRTNLPVTAELQNYVATVTATWNGKTSQPGSSNDVLFGQPYNIPVSFAPTEQQVDLFTAVDNNGDKKTWVYDAANNCFSIQYNSSKAMDDYLILPPVMVTDANRLYHFSFDAWARSTTYPENVEVWIGQEATAAGMTTKVMDNTQITWVKANTKNLGCYFQVPAAGKWYIAVKGVSPRNMYTLYVNNFKVDATNAMLNGPAQVDALEVTPGAEGALKATFKFNMPTKAIDGSTLTGDVTVTVESLVDLKTVTGKPGSAQTVEVMTIQGDNDVTIQPAQGEVLGFPTTVSVYTGVEVPGAVTDFVMTPSESAYGIYGKFSAPEEGVDGGYINKNELTYSLYQNQPINLGIFVIDNWVKILDLGKTMEFQTTDMLPEGTEQGDYELGIAATNVAGTGTILYTTLTLGMPYPLPAIEDYGTGAMTYSLSFNKQGGMSTPQFLDAAGLNKYDPEFGAKGPAVFASGTRDGQFGYFFLPMLSTKGADKVAFEMSYYVGACQDVTVYAETFGVERTQIFKQSYLINYPGGFQTLPIELPAEFQNKEWVNIVVRVDFSADKQYFVWNGYKLVNMVPKDMVALDITAPKRVATGADYKVGVTVANYGITDATAYTVELYANEEKVAEKNCGELASYATNSVEFNLAMSPVADEPIAYYAVVKQQGDANTTNDKTATVEVAPKQSSLPGATALTAGNSEGSVALTWDEPDMENITPDPVTDDFEDADAFAAEYGDWVFVDVDGNAVGGFQGYEIPGITIGETKGSFWIWDQDELGTGNNSFGAHSGTKYLFSLFDANDGTVDDWAISPELAGVEQTIEFYAKSYSSQYPEKLEVWYSTGSTDPKDFIKIEDAGADVVPAEWTLFEAFVPEGAKRFAIRSNGTASFMLMVDDVTYIPAGGVTGDLTLKGYNVYRDGVKINDALVEETAYADSNVTEGTEYTYVVVAIFEEGDGKMSNKATIKYQTSGLNSLEGGKLVAAGKGEIVIKGFEGEQVLISTTDGKVIANGVAAATETVNVPAGIYVVKAGKNSVKVVVR